MRVNFSLLEMEDRGQGRHEGGEDKIRARAGRERMACITGS